MKPKTGTVEWLEQAKAAIQGRHAGAAHVGISTMCAGIKASEGGTRSFTATITTGSKDRDHEVLIPDGMDPTEFKASPTIFWNHWYDQPIGKANSIDKASDGWKSTAEIAARPADYQGDFFPDFAWAMIQQGMVSGVSVGFEPTEERRPTSKDREKHGQDVRSIISKWRLLEWSIAPLQSNIGAVITAVHKGRLSRHAAEAMVPGIDLPRAKKVIVLMPAIKPVDFVAVGNLVAKEIKRRRGAMYD